MTKRFGFTLAEVLITLGIIGVVAAMTIPTLMNSTNNAQFKTGFKKAISTLSQAVTMNYALDGTDFSGLSASNTANTSVYGMFMARMNVIKTTNGTDSALDTAGYSMASASNYTLYFNDGMVLSFPNTMASCTGNACQGVIDINGVKGPNRLVDCSGGAANITTEGATACTTANITYADRYSLLFKNQQVLPNGPASAFVLFN